MKSTRAVKPTVTVKSVAARPVRGKADSVVQNKPQVKPTQAIKSMATIKSSPIPPVWVESDSPNINVGERICKVNGITKPVPVVTRAASKTPHRPTVGIPTDLDQPRFQSSLTLMRKLEQIKQLEVDTQALLSHKLHNDLVLQKRLDMKAALAANVDLCEEIFTHLPSVNAHHPELAALTEEQRRQQMAHKYAPKMINRDPEPILAHSLPEQPRTPSLPKLSFHEQCSAFQIDLFKPKSVGLMDHPSFKLGLDT